MNRLTFSTLLAVLFHIVVLVVVEFLVDLAGDAMPEYSGALRVELQAAEIPVPPAPPEPSVAPAPAPRAETPPEPPATAPQQTPETTTPQATPAQPSRPQSSGAQPGAQPAESAGRFGRRTTAKELREALSQLRSERETSPEERDTGVRSTERDLTPTVEDEAPGEAPRPTWTPNEDAGRTAPGTIGPGDPSATGQAPGEGEERTLSAEQLRELDESLRGGRPGGTPGATPGATGQTGTGNGQPGRTPTTTSPAAIQWENPSAGREPISTPEPQLPAWVEREGLDLRLRLEFELLPSGVLTNVGIAPGGSSGFSDVDAAVVAAVRRWRFPPAPAATTVNGTLPYEIRTQ